MGMLKIRLNMTLAIELDVKPPTLTLPSEPHSWFQPLYERVSRFQEQMACQITVLQKFLSMGKSSRKVAEALKT